MSRARTCTWSAKGGDIVTTYMYVVRSQVVNHCIFSVLAHIATLDLDPGVIWGKKFISDVSFIVLHTDYRESKFKMAAVGHFEYTFDNLAYSAAQ